MTDPASIVKRLAAALLTALAALAGPAPAQAAGNGDAWRHLPYQLGQGLYFPQQGLRIGGYISSHYYDLHGQTATLNLHDLSLFITKQVGTRWQLFSEAEIDDAVTVTDQGANHDSAEFDIERLYADYHARQGVTLRFGKFLTPVGQWNLIHADPLVWTVSRPLTTSAAFSRHATGAMVYGSIPIRQNDLDYWLFLDDSEQLTPSRRHDLAFTTDGASSPLQNDFNHAAGARLLYHLFDDRVSLGASLLDFEFREPEQQYRLIGVDFGWSTRYADLSGEAVYRTRRNTGSVDERGGFVQAVIPLRQRLYLVGRYERYKTAVIAQTTTINTLGVNYRLRPTVSFKVEYRYGSHNALVAPDGWLASFAVLF